MTEAEICFRILKILRRCKPYMLPETELLGQLRAFPEGCLHSEYNAAIGRCEAHKWIIGQRLSMAGTKWRISDVGEAELCNNEQ